MTISEKISKLPFFTNRLIIDTGEMNGVGLVGFKNNDNDVYSNVMASPAPPSGVISNIAMLCTGGNLLRIDEGKKTLLITMAKNGEKEGFSEEFNMNIDDGEFFQQSLIYDFGYIDYTYIEVLHQVLDILHDESGKDQ